jgi:hypothetical protein
MLFAKDQDMDPGNRAGGEPAASRPRRRCWAQQGLLPPPGEKQSFEFALVTGRKLRVLIIVDAFSRFSRRWNRVSHSVTLMLWRYSISSFALISYAQVKRFSR